MTIVYLDDVWQATWRDSPPTNLQHANIPVKWVVF
jgi:hypothetical protein